MHLEEGRKHLWDKRSRIAHNGIPTTVYNLDGEYLGTYLSATIAIVNFVTAGKVNDPKEFNLRKYVKVD